MRRGSIDPNRQIRNVRHDCWRQNVGADIAPRFMDSKQCGHSGALDYVGASAMKFDLKSDLKSDLDSDLDSGSGFWILDLDFGATERLFKTDCNKLRHNIIN